jgi:DNA polymerase/3'-5' exonuclease PolX
MYGVGDKIAQNWYDRGWRTMEDVKKHRSELTKDQKLGLDHYDVRFSSCPDTVKDDLIFLKDLNQTIPKEEMLAYRDVVSKAAHAVHPDFQVYLVGSFRREEASFNDADFIITHPDDAYSACKLSHSFVDRLIIGKKTATSVPRIINEMKKRGVEVIDLGLSQAEHQLYKSICKLKNTGSIYRRVGEESQIVLNGSDGKLKNNIN